MRSTPFILFAFLAGCTLFQQVDQVEIDDADSTTDMAEVDTSESTEDSGPDLRTMVDVGGADDAGPDASACVPIGESCSGTDTCCTLGECGADGTCRPRPCTVSDECSGLQCVRLDASVEARACAEPECAECQGQNWCHPTVGCTNRTPCSDSDSCEANEVCTSENLCVPTCRSSADCGARECRALPAEELASVDDLSARVCGTAVCNCRNADDYCSVDGVCVTDGITCGDNGDCPTDYTCDGLRCVCDENVTDLCRFGCSVDADCDELQLCDPILRRCQTRYCAPGETCPDGYVCGSDRNAPWGAAVCRRAGAVALGGACTDDGECATGLCADDECTEICRRTDDCAEGYDCTFQGGWRCIRSELEPCTGPCADDEFCVANNDSCQAFCSATGECAADEECVTGFGIYNCLADAAAVRCPEDQLLSFFGDECKTFCWHDSDCPNNDCDEALNWCR